MPVHLLAAITPHGFGHAAQVAAVLNVLRDRLPDLRLTLLTAVPPAFLHGRIQGDFELINAAPDFGLVMNSGLAIDLEASAAAYRDTHVDWHDRVDREAGRLERLSPDLVLADVPYLTLAAAGRARIAAVAMCSLNWADIYRHYFAQRAEARRVLEQMEDAYNSARAFLCPQPSMPMPFLHNRVAIGPIATVGRAQAETLRARLDVAADQRLVLVAPGGIKTRFPMDAWPVDQGFHWLVSAEWQVRHPNVSSYQDTGLAFPDLIASCDAVLGKCGYGTVAECVVNATPLMYVPRPDWPEEATLLDWLQAHDGALAVEAQRLISGEFSDLLEPLSARRVRPREPSGAADAADWIVEQLG
jgi:hypothetical protein